MVLIKSLGRGIKLATESTRTAISLASASSRKTQSQQWPRTSATTSSLPSLSVTTSTPLRPLSETTSSQQPPIRISSKTLTPLRSLSTTTTKTNNQELSESIEYNRFDSNNSVIPNTSYTINTKGKSWFTTKGGNKINKKRRDRIKRKLSLTENGKNDQNIENDQIEHWIHQNKKMKLLLDSHNKILAEQLVGMQNYFTDSRDDK